MDGERFDSLSRTLSRSPSRRVFLATLGAALAGALSGPGGSAPAFAKGRKRAHGRPAQRYERESVHDERKKRRKKKRHRGSTVPPTSPTPSPPPPCAPNCTSRACGDDGCGGVCGLCPGTVCNDTICTATGQCQTVPQPDGVPCGGSCRECQSGVCGTTANGTRCTRPNGLGGTCTEGACLPCSASNPCSSGCCGRDGSCGACLAFATSTTYTGNLGGLAGADAQCQARAAAGNLPGTYQAWLSDSINSPATRFRCRAVSCSAQGYTRVDGVTIANDWADLTDGSLDAAISVDELDQSVNGGAWSNTATSGTVGTRGHCQNWTNGTTGTGGIGFNTMSNTFWTDADAVIDCDTLARLYCFQQS